MEEARDLADDMQACGEGRVLDQFVNPDKPGVHYEGTDPEICRDSPGARQPFRERPRRSLRLHPDISHWLDIL